jgi:hypothetical protein
MRVLMAIVVLTALAPMSVARAGGSATEIRNVISGRTCRAGNETYRFGRDGSFQFDGLTTRGRKSHYEGTYEAREGALALHVKPQRRIKAGLWVKHAWVSNGTFQLSRYFDFGHQLGTVNYDCR